MATKASKSEGYNLSLGLSGLSLDNNLIPILIAVALVFLTIAILYYVKRRNSLRRNVLLVGLCESGKTLMFSQLIHKRYVDSHTSIKENVGYYLTPNKGQLYMVDLPGHERLRNKFFDQYKSMSRGIIFVIDSNTFAKDLKDIAQWLYALLGDAIVARNCPRILVACNKQDHTLAKSCKVIQNLLEKEMNNVRITESASLESTTSMSNNNTFLGKPGKDFEFSHLSPLKVEFADCSALESEDSKANLEAVETWLNNVA